MQRKEHERNLQNETKRTTIAERKQEEEQVERFLKSK